jgi:glucose-1-phosphate adenylyltransferase
MAGGEGSRLYPLTAERSKPSVPFGARYRIVDFVLSNLINSGIHAIYLLVQYKSQSLIEHIRQSWVLSPVLPQQFVTVVPPQMRWGREWFQGTADAVRQNLNLIEEHNPKLVAVFGADHIYRMDVRQMVRFHSERNADATVAALPVPVEKAGGFGIIATDPDGRIREFQEKPAQPAPMPGDPSRAFASMGNYLFGAEVLYAALEEAAKRGENDFGRHVLPRLMSTHSMFAYDFSTNQVPGTKDYEEPAYWRDVGTLESYFEATQDVLGLQPRFDVFNPRWPIYSKTYQGPVAKIVSGQIDDSILAGGTLVNNARVRNCILRHEVILDDDVELEDCIIMDYTRIGRGARLRRTVVDRFNVIKPGTRIGFDPEADKDRYHVSPGGIVVVSRGHQRRSGRGSYVHGDA